jgi:hypothetical protein
MRSSSRIEPVVVKDASQVSNQALRVGKNAFLWCPRLDVILSTLSSYNVFGVWLILSFP